MSDAWQWNMTEMKDKMTLCFRHAQMRTIKWMCGVKMKDKLLYDSIGHSHCEFVVRWLFKIYVKVIIVQCYAVENVKHTSSQS